MLEEEPDSPKVPKIKVPLRAAKENGTHKILVIAYNN